MAVSLTAALVFAFYLMAVPVELAVRIRTEPKLSFGTGIAVFNGGLALRRAERRTGSKKKRPAWDVFLPSSEKKGRLRAIKYLLRHMEIEKIAISGSVGASDAAATAMICGFMQAIYAAITPFAWAKKISLQITPDFSGGAGALHLSGMVSISAGHIICAAILSAIYYAKGRIFQWTSIRLKTS